MLVKAQSYCFAKVLQQCRQLRLGAAVHALGLRRTVRCAGMAQLGGVPACEPNSVRADSCWQVQALVLRQLNGSCGVPFARHFAAAW
jgi:hypothetical protein